MGLRSRRRKGWWILGESRLIFGIWEISVGWKPHRRSLLWHTQEWLLRNGIRLVFIVRLSIRKLKAKNIIAVETITLQSVDDNRSLKSRFKISETQNDFLTGLLLPRNESNSLESQKWSKNMWNFTLSGVDRNAFHIHSIGGVLRNRKDSVLIKHRLKMSHEIKLLLGLNGWWPSLRLIGRLQII